MDWYKFLGLALMLLSSLLVLGLFFVLVAGIIGNPFYAFVGFIAFCFIAGSSPIWIDHLWGE